MKTRIIYTLACVLLLALLLPCGSVMATDNPDSVGFGNYGSDTVKVFRNLIESGDSLFTFHYKITYDSGNYPLETASDTIIFKLYDDAGNETATFTPYVLSYFGNNGYGDGIAAVYLSASDYAPSWESAAQIKIDGWPIYFTAFSTFTYDLVPTDYITYTSQEENRDALKETILLWCDRLSSIYSSADIILKTSSDSGEVLTGMGETYFGGAIKGLQAMCPELFYIQVYVPEVLSTSYNMTMADFYRTRALGSEWDEGFTNIGASIGTSGIVVATLIFAGISIFICIWCVKKDWGIEAGGALSAIVGVAAALIVGDVLFGIMMLVSLIAVLGMAWLFGFRRIG